MLICSIAFFVLTVLFMGAEAIYERDWPREPLHKSAVGVILE